MLTAQFHARGVPGKPSKAVVICRTAMSLDGRRLANLAERLDKLGD
jgi:hypothetical protein